MIGAESRQRARRRSAVAAAGFTLMEMLVVLGLFSTTVVAASDIFLLANRSQRKVFSLERTQADARYAMEAMTREIRSGRIDYDYYAARGTAAGAPDTELALVDSTGTPILFHVSDASDEASCPDATSVPCLFVTVGGSPPAPITPKGVSVRSASFYIAPADDPAIFDAGTGTYTSSVQPHVTIVLVMDGLAQKVEDRARVQFQTTVSSREYVR